MEFLAIKDIKDLKIAFYLICLFGYLIGGVYFTITHRFEVFAMRSSASRVSDIYPADAIFKEKLDYHLKEGKALNNFYNQEMERIKKSVILNEKYCHYTLLHTINRYEIEKLDNYIDWRLSLLKFGLDEWDYAVHINNTNNPNSTSYLNKTYIEYIDKCISYNYETINQYLYNKYIPFIIKTDTMCKVLINSLKIRLKIIEKQQNVMNIAHNKEKRNIEYNKFWLGKEGHDYDARVNTKKYGKNIPLYIWFKYIYFKYLNIF